MATPASAPLKTMTVLRLMFNENPLRSDPTVLRDEALSLPGESRFRHLGSKRVDRREDGLKGGHSPCRFPLTTWPSRHML